MIKESALRHTDHPVTMVFHDHRSPSSNNNRKQLELPICEGPFSL